ncbi:MAG: nitrilase-related carbon-nitrogen hydrolase [Bacteroidales bacterium]
MTGYGVQDKREVFTNPVTATTIAPVICYESVFGRFITDFTRQGAELICIITNDGWWRNTSGYRQHLAFASLRAIENRRWVARCANTGISCFIDERGKIVEKTGWWEEAILAGNVS